MSNNLPEKIPDPYPQEDGIYEAIRRRNLAALAESALKFRRMGQDALDTLMPRMILKQLDLDGEKFRTPNGRNCMLVLAVGDDAVGKLTDAVFDLQNPRPSKPKNFFDDDQNPR